MGRERERGEMGMVRGVGSGEMEEPGERKRNMWREVKNEIKGEYQRVERWGKWSLKGQCHEIFPQFFSQF